MKDLFDEFLEEGELGAEALEDESGDPTMGGEEMFDRIFKLCMNCRHQDQSCVDYLNELSEKFMTGERMDVACPKGLVKL